MFCCSFPIQTGVRTAAAVLTCFILAGCDRTLNMPTMSASSPSPASIRLDVADDAFRLSAEERSRVRAGFDVDALERLLAAIQPEVRPLILEHFYDVQPHERIRALTRMGDPALQPLLDEVWAPVWDRFPEILEHETKDFPGLELARTRRIARDDPGQSQPQP